MGIVPVIVRSVSDPISSRFPIRARCAWALVGAASLIATGCGSDDGSTSSPTGDSAAAIDVVASFYPLQFVAEQVGGSLVRVSNLTPAGAEPHDLELTARDTVSLQEAGLVLYLDGFMPALDDGIDSTGASAFDVAAAARLDLAGRDDDHADEDDEDEDHAEEIVDPHFWLDPTRLADVADAVAVRFGELTPDDAEVFAANAAALRTRLETLDGDFRAGLAECASGDLVTSHEAFGYLAARYGLTQIGISALSPDEEPSPARLAEVTDFVQANDVRTIYFETLVDPSIAETIAAETGATTAVLDPLEGLTDESAGDDYLSVMEANLATLRSGQSCA
jgi:zinc transport system substrate-binding protein